jgi:hypothetical protein
MALALLHEHLSCQLSGAASARESAVGSWIWRRGAAGERLAVSQRVCGKQKELRELHE